VTLEDTVHTAYEAWSRRDIDALLEVVHPDAEARPILGANIGISVYRGREGLREWFRDLHQEWETFQTRVTQIDARDERDERALLTVEVHARGRASGVVIEGDLYHLVEIRDGLILRLEAFRDRDSAVKAFEAT
jgi:ketosteroid isomerase-like protein